MTASHRTRITQLAVIAATLLLAACAKMGKPDGGWYDETPPRILKSFPDDKAANVDTKNISIFFDEYIKVDNPTEKVVVSPPQLEQAEIKAEGRKISIELADTLKPNTTYTIDFSDAITDNNEGNPLGNYTYSFSTGDHIDTLEVSGHVLNASDLEPVKGILVGLYSDTADSAFRKKPMLRVSRTDGSGRFVIKGVAEGKYRIYALQDADGNYMFSQKGEMLAFSHDLIEPSFKPDVRQDTIWQDSLRIRDIKRTKYTHFLPDDIVLRAFTETQTDRYLLKSERTEAEYFTLFFSYGDSIMPTVKGLNFDEKDAFITETSLNRDTITYWLRDTLLVNQDTLKAEIAYMSTDSSGVLRQQTDTLEILSRKPYAKRLKTQQEEYDKWKKRQEKREKKGKPFETEMPKEALKPDYNIPSSLDPDQYLTVYSPTPLEKIDTAAIHIYEKIDTTWYRKSFAIGGEPGKNRTYRLVAEWTPGAQYSFETDTIALTDIYGKVSAPFKQGFNVRSTDEYCNITMNLTGLKDTMVVVQLLNSSDKVVKETFTDTGVGMFYYVKAGTYFIRAFVDSNRNGVWDTGEYDADRQPEAVFYYPEEIECRAKWDFTETWNPTARSLSRQKPGKITKQKSEKKKTIKNRNMERAQKLGLEYLPKGVTGQGAK